MREGLVLHLRVLIWSVSLGVLDTVSYTHLDVYKRQILEYAKNITFNGEGEYPMEFVKELEELHREHYLSEGVNWVSRHLEGEAAIWWKLIRSEIKTFSEFQEAFTAKYWNQMIQEVVRDRLEFGKYRPESRLSMVQHMERCILQNLSLIHI